MTQRAFQLSLKVAIELAVIETARLANDKVKAEDDARSTSSTIAPQPGGNMKGEHKPRRTRSRLPIQKQLRHTMMGGRETFTIPGVEGEHTITDKFSDQRIDRHDDKINTSAGRLPLNTVVTVIRRDW